MKLTETLLIATLLLSSCGHEKQNNQSTDNEKLVKQYFEHFNNHEWIKMANMYMVTADFKDPSLGQGVVRQTRQQTIEKYRDLNKIFPDLHDQVTQTYPSGDHHIIVEFVSSGTGPDSAKFELAICTKDFTYFDNFEEQ
jgi:hypothetical protein